MASRSCLFGKSTNSGAAFCRRGSLKSRAGMSQSPPLFPRTPVTGGGTVKPHIATQTYSQERSTSEAQKRPVTCCSTSGPSSQAESFWDEELTKIQEQKLQVVDSLRNSEVAGLLHDAAAFLGVPPEALASSCMKAHREYVTRGADTCDTDGIHDYLAALLIPENTTLVVVCDLHILLSKHERDFFSREDTPSTKRSFLSKRAIFGLAILLAIVATPMLKLPEADPSPLSFLGSLFHFLGDFDPKAAENSSSASGNTGSSLKPE
eukprot:TRINITY_DN11781_c0_g1_i1.p1 TRINITY_DN11781_c0_g1~~TRINITY_DN11781_c0_g1_i1.p1  ORF type:complete len:264 (+),score=31.79 TRINITY_DN11781_c0_g1_i1:467-1258(+)